MQCLNVTNVAMAIVTAGLILVPRNRVEAQPPSETSASKIVTDEVAQVEGGFHRSKDRTVTHEVAQEEEHVHSR